MECSEKRAYEAIQQLMLLKHEKVMSYTQQAVLFPGAILLLAYLHCWFLAGKEEENQGTAEEEGIRGRESED